MVGRAGKGRSGRARGAQGGGPLSRATPGRWMPVVTHRSKRTGCTPPRASPSADDGLGVMGMGRLCPGRGQERVPNASGLSAQVAVTPKLP